MPKDHSQRMEEKLDAVIVLLQHLVALKLYKNGVNHGGISKRLHVHTTKIGEMLRGVKNEKQTHE